MVVIGLAENVRSDPTKVRGPTNTMPTAVIIPQWRVTFLSDIINRSGLGTHTDRVFLARIAVHRAGTIFQ